jgi:hypothetical protein
VVFSGGCNFEEGIYCNPLDAMDFYHFVAEQVVCFLLFSHVCTEIFQLPELKPYPNDQSVLVLDNCRIHHNEALVELVQATGAGFSSYLRYVYLQHWSQVAFSCIFHHIHQT